MKIALCLSGGGFRAMLFHLGVIRTLGRAGLLRGVERIDAVSGGSVLAADLVLRWDEYCADVDGASKRLVALARRDVRGRVVRRYFIAGLFPVPLLLCVIERLLSARLASRFRLGVTELLKREYRWLYGDARLSKLSTLTSQPRPHLYLHATSLHTGGPCAFGVRPQRSEHDKANDAFFVRWEDGSSPEFAAEQVPIVVAVAASSAFPPFFQPVHISSADVTKRTVEFGQAHPLTDGGVFDNLGIHRVLTEECSFDWVVVSDASGAFGPDDRDFRGLINRNVRASDLLMQRNSVLQRDLCGFPSRGEPAPPEAHGRPLIVPIKMRPVDPGDDPALGETAQDAVRNFRTDLDVFSDIEIDHLRHHGAAVAASMLRRAGFLGEVPDVPPVAEAPIDILRKGRKRTKGLWSLRDPFGMLYAILFCFWLGLAGWGGYRAWTQPELMLTADAWPKATSAWLNEPSGLAPTGLTRQGQPVLLSVDDEESGIFVLQLLESKVTGVIKVLNLGELKDLEAVAVDPCNGREAIAVTSHRQLGVEASSRLVKFTLPESLDDDSVCPVPSASINLDKLLLDALQRKKVPINSKDWEQEKGKADDDPKKDDYSYHPYEVEIEGAAYRDGKVTIGLRWPLWNEEAILVEFDFGDDKADDVWTLPLRGMGISALTWVGDALYIVANPPGKERDGVKSGYPYGRSVVYRLAKKGEVPQPLALEKEQILDAKLEGIAIDHDAIIGAFDGPGHTIRYIGQVAPGDRLEPSLWERARHAVIGSPSSRCQPTANQ